MPRRSTKARSKPATYIEPRDYRVVVVFTSIYELEEVPLADVLEALEGITRGRSFKVLETRVDKHNRPIVTFSMVYNTVAADEEELWSAIAHDYDDELAGDVEFDDVELIRVGVSTNVQRLTDRLPFLVANDTAAIALGEGGTLNAQLLYDLVTATASQEHIRNELLGVYSSNSPWPWYTPSLVFQVREDSNLICRMVEHKGVMRWLPVGTTAQVMGTAPFEPPPQSLLPIDPVGAAPFYYSCEVNATGDSEEQVRATLIAEVPELVNGDVVSAGSLEIDSTPKEVTGKVRIVYRTDDDPNVRLNPDLDVWCRQRRRVLTAA
jgi:hypothetical protein